MLDSVQVQDILISASKIVFQTLFDENAFINNPEIHKIALHPLVQKSWRPDDTRNPFEYLPEVVQDDPII